MSKSDYQPSGHLVGYQAERQDVSPPGGRLALASFVAVLLALVVLNVVVPDPAPASSGCPAAAIGIQHTK